MLQPHDIETLIDQMARTTRTAWGGPGPAAHSGRWWVLICGGPLDPRDFDQREGAREGLRRQAAALGVAPAECVWVWDEANTVQLVAGRFADRERAEHYARELTARGLRTRLVTARDD